jgi:hypothetical protein
MEDPIPSTDQRREDVTQRVERTGLASVNTCRQRRGVGSVSSWTSPVPPPVEPGDQALTCLCPRPQEAMMLLAGPLRQACATTELLTQHRGRSYACGA